MADGVGSTPISLRVPNDLLQKLDEIASVMDRPRSWVCLRALRQYLTDEGAEILDVREGIAQLDRGEGVPLDEVTGELQQVIAKAEAKHTVG